jgi:hypothetical protein
MRFTEFRIKEDQDLFHIDVPKGRRGTEIRDVQQALLALGYSLPKHGADGIRGPETVSAIKAFQQANQLTVDGDPGPETVGKLNDILKTKPDIAGKLVKSLPTDVKVSTRSSAKIDISAIQDPDFNKKLEKIAKDLGVEANTLRAIIKNESRGDPTALFQSKTSKFRAGGLIGFTEDTARMLGTTLDDILRMTAVEQLDYVYMFYKKVGVQPGMNRGEIYMLTFLPAYAKASDDTVLGKQGGGTLPGTGLSMDKIWYQNPMFGRSKGRDSFTVADVKNTINNVA